MRSWKSRTWPRGARKSEGFGAVKKVKWLVLAWHGKEPQSLGYNVTAGLSLRPESCGQKKHAADSIASLD